MKMHHNEKASNLPNVDLFRYKKLHSFRVTRRIECKLAPFFFKQECIKEKNPLLQSVIVTAKML